MNSVKEQLFSFLYSNRVVLYCEVASFSLWVYDYLVSLDSEIRLVWRAPWKLGKVLFFLTRYIAFVRMVVTTYLVHAQFLPINTCKSLSQASSVFTFFGLYVSEIILSLRLWAVWGRSKRIAVLLVFGCLLPVAALAIYTVIINKLDVTDFFARVYDSFGICPSYLSGVDSVVRLFIYLVVLEGVIFVLTVYKAIEYWWSQGISTTSLIQSFFRDGLIYNVVVLLTSTVNIVLRSTTADRFMSDTFLALQMVFHSILTSRMLLHLRSASIETTNRSQPLGSIRFASNPAATYETSTGNQENLHSRILSPVNELQSWFGEGFQNAEDQLMEQASNGDVMREID